MLKRPELDIETCSEPDEYVDFVMKAEAYMHHLEAENKTFRRLMREELERQGYTFNADKFEKTLKEEMEK